MKLFDKMNKTIENSNFSQLSKFPASPPGIPRLPTT